MSDLIHCITNPISMMQCANAVLALGAKPIMAEHPMEVFEITKTADALLINTGNISDTRMEAMRISFDTAVGKKIPVVIDAVGTACSNLRRRFVTELLENALRQQGNFLLIKGNYSEIKALTDEVYRGKGVDADKELGEDEIIAASKRLSEKYSAVVLASGAKDIITDGKSTFLVGNGHPMMSDITGTGCMLGAICATFLAGEESIRAVADACCFFGIAGELAYEKLIAAGESSVNESHAVGAGSYLISLLDAISCTDMNMEEHRKKLEKNER